MTSTRESKHHTASPEQEENTVSIQEECISVRDTMVSVTHEQHKRISKLQNAFLFTLQEIFKIHELDDNASLSLQSLLNHCLEECGNFCSEFKESLNNCTEIDLSKSEDEKSIKSFQKQILKDMGKCLNVFDKQNRLFLEALHQIKEILPESYRQLPVELCKNLCRELSVTIEDISTYFYHPIALNADENLKSIQKTVDTITGLLKTIDTKLAFIQSKLTSTHGKNAIAELRSILGNVLLNSTIHDDDLTLIVMEIYNIIDIAKSCAPLALTPLIESIAIDIKELQRNLREWKLTTPKYYASMTGRYGIPLAIGVLTTLIPSIPDVSALITETGTLAGEAIGHGTDAVIAGQILADQSATLILSTSSLPADYVIEENIMPHRGVSIAPHVTHHKNKLAVTSEHLWKETILKESILKWVEKNQIDLALTAVSVTTSLITIPFTVTGALAPISAAIIGGSVAGVKLTASAIINIHDARKLAAAEKELMAVTLNTLAECRKKFEAWKQYNSSKLFWIGREKPHSERDQKPLHSNAFLKEGARGKKCL